jgi:hypothetical protein
VVRGFFFLSDPEEGKKPMTKFEEYQYLSDLVMQAALWRVDKDEGRVALELEVLERLNNLKEELNGCDGPKVTTTLTKDYKAKWAEGKCRIGGKWFKKSDCIKVPRKDGIGWKWALKSEVDDVPSEERN